MRRAAWRHRRAMASLARRSGRAVATLADRLLTRLLARPRALQVAGALIGAALLLLTPTWPFEPALATPPLALRPSTPTLEAQTAPVEQELLALVAAYNQASIAAATLGRADPLAPYLATDGAAWTTAQAEYERRAARGESHDPALVRWGVLQITMEGDSASVETQEQWDDLVSVGGAVVASQRGILTRNHYTLRRSPAAPAWQITDVTTTIFMQ